MTGDSTAARATETPAPVATGASDPEGDLGWHLGVMLRAYQSTVGVVVGEFPHATRGYQILGTVVRGQEPTQLALAARLGIDRTVMTYLIDDLVAAGLVERRQNPADRRARMIVATEQGSRAFEQLELRVRATEDRLLGALDAADRETFRALMARVACAVKDVDAQTDPCAVVTDVLGVEAR